MQVFLSNTLAKGAGKVPFEPIDSAHIKMYVCGPTVYDRPHLGNARSAVVYDILYRCLTAIYPRVTYVRNITDVDDKIIDAARKTGSSISEITTKYTTYYHDDIGALNCLLPDHEPRATRHINDMIAMIERLIAKGFAYCAGGHVLFSVERYKNYGHLSNKSLDDMIAGARVEVADYKRAPGDFVLWKPAGEADGFDSPWGLGRPGWHIECSAMSRVFLGDQFDIHGGGADLKFPHHENEIAQSCCANGTDFMAKYWVHNGFLTVSGEKMSKSLNNFTTVRDLLDKGLDGNVIRLFYLGTHYRKPIDFSQKAIDDAQKNYDKFQRVINAAGLQHSDITGIDQISLEFLADDLNTPKVIARAHEVAAQNDAKTLCQILNLLGVAVKSDIKDIRNAEDGAAQPEVERLAALRAEAKAAKDWATADKLRDQIADHGYKMVDLPGNQYEIRKI